MIKILFFDIGYTLVDEGAAWKARCEAQAATDEAKRLNLSADDIFREIENASRLRLPPFKTVVKKFNFSFAAPYRHELEKLYASVPNVLKTLSKKYALGVIANQASGLKERLKEFNILKYFSYVISSSDVQFQKPDVRIYEYAIKAANCLPREAVMIGDRLDNDIAPAKAVGMKTVWVKQGFGRLQTPDENPDYTIDEISQVVNIF